MYNWELRLRSKTLELLGILVSYCIFFWVWIHIGTVQVLAKIGRKWRKLDVPLFWGKMLMDGFISLKFLD